MEINTSMKRLLRIIWFLIKICIAYVCTFFIKIMKPDMRDIWILSERGDDARDNGYFFYKYLKENHPEQKAVYIIKKTSSDYSRVEELGKVIEYGSFKHYIYYALCRVRISSSVWGGDIPKADYVRQLPRLFQKKNVFLQHGIIKDFQPGLEYPNIQPDLFICGAKPEYDYVKSEFNHPEGVVRYTGLARFDNLHQYKEKKQILIMPTFRKWLQNITVEEFLDSEFYKEWNSILCDSNLNERLLKSNIKLIFYPHYELQKFVDCFNNASSNIVIADFAHFDVQQLLKESQLLITDFSSVFFDFGYMGKPVIYFQFDRKKYINEHYDFTKGYFSYDEMGFGKVVYQSNKLISEILECMNNNFSLDEKFRMRIDKFFELKDNKNSERIYDAIHKAIYH